MRPSFFSTLYKLAQKDNRIMLIVADIGFGAVDSFRENLRHQFVNAGAAEQNMIGIATGLALSEKIVFVYSISNFPTLRCLEQIRSDICYHNANVKVVSGGGGFAYGALGASHHMTEDIAIMRSLPNMVVIAPGDPFEASQATKALVEQNGPAYLRLGRTGEPMAHRVEMAFSIGKAITLREGNDVTLMSTGDQLFSTINAADKLSAAGISTRVLSMHTIKPLDCSAILDAARETEAIFTIEEHTIIGGLGGAVSEILMESCQRPKYFRRIGINDAFPHDIGSQDYLKAKYMLDTDGIVDTVVSTLS